MSEIKCLHCGFETPSHHPNCPRLPKAKESGEVTDEKEKVQEIADQIKPIMSICDALILDFDFDQADKSLVKMKDHLSKMEASEVIGLALGVDAEAKIREVGLTNDIYEAAINLLKCRKAQRDNALKTLGDSQLKSALAKKMGW